MSYHFPQPQGYPQQHPGNYQQAPYQCSSTPPLSYPHQPEQYSQSQYRSDTSHTNIQSGGFHKPDTVTLRFKQKAYYKSGTIVDSAGRTVYSLRFEGDDHEFSRLYTAYPLQITRQSDGGLLVLDWKSSAKKATIKGLTGKDKHKIMGDLLDDNLGFRVYDVPERFEWDGIWGNPFNLLDYRIPQPNSLKPAISAVFTPRTKTKDDSVLEVHPSLFSVPGLMDTLVVTAIWIEYNIHLIANDPGNAISEGAAESFGEAIGAAIVGGGS